MNKKTVSCIPDTLPPLTAAQKKHLDALAWMPDSKIDTSDTPELTAAQLDGMQPVAFYRPVKRQITARVDADVLAWLKSQGRGYQSRMNAILRREMLQAQNAAGRK